jgi:hypothetical protein
LIIFWQPSRQSCLFLASVPSGVSFAFQDAHIAIMVQWQASITRAPPKTKAELRQILTEAVRNTQAGAPDGVKRPLKPEKGSRLGRGS